MTLLVSVQFPHAGARPGDVAGSDRFRRVRIAAKRKRLTSCRWSDNSAQQLLKKKDAGSGASVPLWRSTRGEQRWGGAKPKAGFWKPRLPKHVDLFQRGVDSGRSSWIISTSVFSRQNSSACCSLWQRAAFQLLSVVVSCCFSPLSFFSFFLSAANSKLWTGVWLCYSVEVCQQKSATSQKYFAKCVIF